MTLDMCARTRKIRRGGDIEWFWFTEHQGTSVSHDTFRLGIVLERPWGTKKYYYLFYKKKIKNVFKINYLIVLFSMNWYT